MYQVLLLTHQTTTKTKQNQEKEEVDGNPRKRYISHRIEINSSIYTYEIVLECKEKSL